MRQEATFCDMCFSERKKLVLAVGTYSTPDEVRLDSCEWHIKREAKEHGWPVTRFVVKGDVVQWPGDPLPSQLSSRS